MKDGTVFYTNYDVKFYGNKNDFRDFAMKEKNDIRIQNNQKWKKDSIYGYNEEREIEWNKVKFGDWIKDYGLIPGDIYFVKTLNVFKYIPATCEEMLIPGSYFVWDEDSIGTVEGMDKVGFYIINRISFGYYEAFTRVKCISYNKDGEKVNVYFPLKPDKLKWKYFRGEIIVWED